MINLYMITADYRPKNPNKPRYYVVAANKKEAREKFAAKISWLKIYGVDPVDQDKAFQIIGSHEKYIIIE